MNSQGVNYFGTNYISWITTPLDIVVGSEFSKTPLLFGIDHETTTCMRAMRAKIFNSFLHVFRSFDQKLGNSVENLGKLFTAIFSMSGLLLQRHTELNLRPTFGVQRPTFDIHPKKVFLGH